MAQTSFAKDILPMFSKWQAQMMWRLDLTNYEHVKANADIIYGRLTGTAGDIMPPPRFSPFDAEQLNTFKLWMNEGCPQ